MSTQENNKSKFVKNHLILFFSVFVIFLFIGMVFLPFIYADNENMESMGWWQYAHDSGHAWWVNTQGPKNNPEIIWKERIFASYAFGYKIFIYKNYLIALSLDAVKIFDKNTMQLIDVIKEYAIRTLAVYNGTIYVATYGKLLAYDLNGHLKWSINHTFHNPDLSLLIDSKGIFLCERPWYIAWVSFQGKVKKIWKFKFLWLFQAPVIYKDRIYVLNYTNCIYVINITTNKTSIIKLPNPDIRLCDMVIDSDGTIYAVARSQLAYSIDKNGTTKWVYKLKHYPAGWDEIVIGRTMLYYINDRINYTLVISLNKSNGLFVRKYEFKPEYFKAITDRCDDLYLLSLHTLSAYSSDGHLLWKIRIGDSNYSSWDSASSFLISDGYVYLITYLGYLYKIGTPEFLHDIYTIIIPILFILGLLILGVWRWNKEEMKDKGEKV